MCFYFLGEKSINNEQWNTLTLNVIVWENYDLDTSVSYKKDNSLLELTLNFQFSFEHLDEAFYIL